MLSKVAELIHNQKYLQFSMYIWTYFFCSSFS